MNNKNTLQRSYQTLIHPYARHITHAVTLTLKLRAKVRVKRFENYGNECFEYWVAIDEEKINSTLRRFTARLTALLYGNHAKHKNKQAFAKPLIIAAVEGLRSKHKRPHIHLALGNIPQAKLARINDLIEQAWRECDFGYKEIIVKPMHDELGWLNYITKEVGYANDDVLDVVASTIPQFIQQST